MFAAMPPVGLSRLHMDPEGQVPGILSDTMLLSDGLDDAAIDAIAAIAGTGANSPLVMIELRHLGGALARSGADHGVLDRLPGEFLAFGAGIPMTEELAALVEAHLGRLRDALGAYDTQRRYLNFTERKADAAAFFGEERHAALQGVRERVDPDRVMLANHPVG
jgi:hypothetical protein